MTVGGMMTGRKKRRAYGDPLGTLWSLLNNLRLKCKEHGKGKTGTHHIVEIADFGILIHIASSAITVQDTNAPGLIKIKYNTDFTIPEAEQFGEELMWNLIERGYLAWIREDTLLGGNERIFSRLVMANGWGQRIIDRRMKDWEGRADRIFLLSRLKKINEGLSISEILSRWPSFFDYLS